MKAMLDKGAFAPERAHETDAGLDLRAKQDMFVPALGSAVIGTGVHVELPEGCAGLLVSKSGLNVNHNLTSTGLIDQGYTGEVMVKLHNHGRNGYQVKAGDKISQLVVMPVLYEPVEIVDAIDGAGDRGDNGFGSTGR
ncbi:MAG: dUTP diphosphatase [Clostridia bacterium]|nr:dUTP diphosphatase [Clostridia bacterium]